MAASEPAVSSIAAWLTAIDFEPMQRSTLAKRVEGTSDWILEHQEFNSWVAGRSRTPVLWCHGLAGTGKTVSTSIAIDSLRRSEAGIGIAFVYCDAEARPAQTARALLSSLCGQLVAQISSMRPQSSSKVPLPPLLLKLYEQEVAAPDVDDLMHILTAICGRQSNNSGGGDAGKSGYFDGTFIFIDGLDELVLLGERAVFLQKLRWLWNLGVKVFVTSATHGDHPDRCECHRDIEEVLGDYDHILVEAIPDDITKAVHARLRDYHEGGEEILAEAGDGFETNEVVRRAVEKSGGMFLMALLKLDRRVVEARELVAERRERGSERSDSIRREGSVDSYRSGYSPQQSSGYQSDTSDILPSRPLGRLSLDELEVISIDSRTSSISIWQEVLDKIEAHEEQLRRECAITALSWILYAEEPLSVHDLGLVLKMDMVNSDQVRFWVNGFEMWIEGLEEPLRPPDLKRVEADGGWPPENTVSLVNLCEGLVNINPRGLVVLRRSWDLGDEKREETFPQADKRILETCLRAWIESFENKSARFIESSGDALRPPGPRRRDTVREYTEANWSAHLLACEELRDFPDDDLVLGFLSMRYDSRPTWIEERQPLMRDPYKVQVTDNETPVLKLARLGLDRLLEIQLERMQYPIDAVSFRRQTAISAAVFAGHTSTTQILLKHGASIHYRNDLGDSLLHIAASRDDEIMVALLIEMGLDKDTTSRGQNGSETALYKAIGDQNMEAARMLLRYGADTSKGGRSILLEAARTGNIEAVKLLVEQGADLNASVGGAGVSPLLFTAVRSKSEELVEYLLQNGASTTRLNSSRQSVFHVVPKGCLGILKLLFQYCDDPLVAYREEDGKYFEDSTAVENAMSSRDGDEEIAEHLISHMPPGVPGEVILGMAAGAVYNNRRELAKRLICMAPQPLRPGPRKDHRSSLIGGAIFNKDEEILDMLLSRGLSPNYASADHWLPLHIAPMKHFSYAVAPLVAHGAHVNAAMPIGMAGLHWAAVYDATEVAEALLEHGADFNMQTKVGMSPIHIATHQGATSTLKVLLDYKPDLSLRAADGSTPLVISGRARRYDITQLLLEHGADIAASNLDGETMLHFAALDGEMEVVQSALVIKEASLSLSVCALKGGTPLHYAASAGNVDIAQHLLDHGADANSPHNFAGTGFKPQAELSYTYGVTWGQAGPMPKNMRTRPWMKIETRWTPLHSAACAGSVGVAELLLARGARVSAKGVAGDTPLHVASSAAKASVVQVLVARGASVCDADDEGNTALHHAAAAEIAIAVGKEADSGKCYCQLDKERRHGHADHSKGDCVAMLLSLGADATAENKAGLSPLAIAVGANHADIVGALIAHTTREQLTSAVYVKILQTCRGKDKTPVQILKAISDVFVESDESRQAWGDILTGASVSGDLALAQLAVDKGAAPTAESLANAIRREHVTVVDALLAAGADIHETLDARGRTALHLAATSRDEGRECLTVMHGNRRKEQIARAILRVPTAEVNDRTARNGTAGGGDTALHFAVQTGDEELVRTLLEHSASVDIRNGKGRTPLHAALEMYVFPGIVGQLLRKGASPTATDFEGRTPAHLVRDRGAGAVQAVEMLLAHGADAAAPDCRGNTPVHSAVGRGNWAAAERLLSDRGGGKLAMFSRGAGGRTPLIVAARRGNAVIVEALRKLGADVEMRDDRGWTALQHAQVKELVEVVRALSK